MNTVKQILDRKGYDVWSITPDSTVSKALRFMAEKNIGAVMVIQGDELVGIFSERDYARKVWLYDKKADSTIVKDVMTKQIIGVQLDQKIDECLALMSGKCIRHLPVIDSNRQIVGVISIGDLVTELIFEQAHLIDQLVNYITGEKMKPLVPKKTKVEIT